MLAGMTSSELGDWHQFYRDHYFQDAQLDAHFRAALFHLHSFLPRSGTYPAHFSLLSPSDSVISDDEPDDDTLMTAAEGSQEVSDMAQQISDLVIKLDVDRATFSEQVARIKGQLTGMADESDKVQARMQRAADRQSAALKSVGDAGAAAAADMKARQSAATEGLAKDWQNVSKSVDETHRRVTELNQRMRENDGQAAALARRQDELAASFSARLTAFASSMVKRSRLRTCRRAFVRQGHRAISPSRIISP